MSGRRSKKDLFEAAFAANAEGDPKRALALAEEAVALDPGDEEARRIAVYWACHGDNEAKALKHARHLSHHEWSLVAGTCSRSDIMLPEPVE